MESAARHHLRELRTGRPRPSSLIPTAICTLSILTYPSDRKAAESPARRTPPQKSRRRSASKPRTELPCRPPSRRGCGGRRREDPYVLTVAHGREGLPVLSADGAHKRLGASLVAHVCTQNQPDVASMHTV